MALKKILDPVSELLDKACSVLIVVMLGAMVVITGAQIVCRTWFTALTWSEELTRYLLVWSTFLGATVVYRHSGNIAITIVQEHVPARAGKALRVAVHVVCFALFAVIFGYSVPYCLSLPRTATTLPLRMSTVYMCIPISMAVLMIHALKMALDEWTSEVKAQ